MPDARKRPCAICRRWFRPDPRVGDRQHVCREPQCQAKRRQKTQASWQRRNPDYAAAYRLQQRKAQADPPPEPLRLPPPLNQLPWDLAKDQFGAQGADFLGVLGALLVRAGKDQFRTYVFESRGLGGTLPALAPKTRSGLGHTEARTDGHATGVSPTRPALGTLAGPRSAPAPASAGLTG